MTESIRVVKMKTLESRGSVAVQIFRIWWLQTAVVLEPL
jgi:hypothetical protein